MPTSGITFSQLCQTEGHYQLRFNQPSHAYSQRLLSMDQSDFLCRGKTICSLIKLLWLHLTTPALKPSLINSTLMSSGSSGKGTIKDRWFAFWLNELNNIKPNLPVSFRESLFGNSYNSCWHLQIRLTKKTGKNLPLALLNYDIETRWTTNEILPHQVLDLWTHPKTQYSHRIRKWK